MAAGPTKNACSGDSSRRATAFANIPSRKPIIMPVTMALFSAILQLIAEHEHHGDDEGKDQQADAAKHVSYGRWPMKANLP